MTAVDEYEGGLQLQIDDKHGVSLTGLLEVVDVPLDEGERAQLEAAARSIAARLSAPE